jgi:hypothetical protein
MEEFLGSTLEHLGLLKFKIRIFQVLHILNLGFMFYFFKNSCKALPTHFANVTLFGSK